MARARGAEKGDAAWRGGGATRPAGRHARGGGGATAAAQVENKDNPLLEFEPANKAYADTSLKGFRTFAAWIFPETSRGAAAAGTWIFPRRRVAATPRLGRGYSRGDE